MSKDLKMELTENAVKRAFKFAFIMAKEKRHRENRSGGTLRRNSNQVFINTFYGKLGEEGYRRYILNKGAACSKINYEIMDIGEWDDGDLVETINGINYCASIKTVKHFSKYLFLERKDFLTKMPQYKLISKNPGYFSLCGVKILSGEVINKLPHIDFNNEIKDEFIKTGISLSNLELSYMGSINNTLVKYFIDIQESENIYIKKGENIPGTTVKIDADNYYIHKNKPFAFSIE